MSPRRPPAPGASSPRASRPEGAAGAVRGAPRPKTPARTAGSSTRPSSRPAAATRPRSGTAGRSERPARSAVRAGTGRPMWVLGAVFVALALLILPYFQKWLVQRSEIEQARAGVSQSQQAVDQLRKQQARWQDDEYVKAQARARLHYVMPGEQGFVVVDPAPAAKRATRKTDGQAAAVPEGNRPWYSDVWLSAQVAAEK